MLERMAGAAMVPSRQLFIGGSWVAPAQGGRIPITNPATEETIGSIPSATSEDVDAAVSAAREAYTRNGGKDWARATGAHRAKYLRAMAAKITAQKETLAKLESMDNGKPLDEAMWDMDDVAGCFEFYADLAEKLDLEQGAPFEVPMEQFKCSTRKEPLGVVALITPWNYPLLMGAWKVAPALAAGCACILKPSEIASMTCLELGAIAQEVELPPGVLNIITGWGPSAGGPLSSHPGIDKVAFTGSSATGKAVLKAAAENLKPATMELGGKSAIMVFDDVDLDKAVEWAMFGCFWTNGQICSATSRLLVQSSIAEAFKARIAQWASSIQISDPLAPGCRLGPIISEGQYKKVLGFIEEAKAQGAVVLTGGKRPASATRGYFVDPTVLENATRGYFVEPTVLEVKPHMTIWQEEVFGPVLSLATFDTEAEAIAMANDTTYGLAASVISNDPGICKRVSEAMETGIVWINCSQPTFVQGPWGGKKRSGFGRELGKWGLDNYLSVKQVVNYVSTDPWGWYPAPSKL